MNVPRVNPSRYDLTSSPLSMNGHETKHTTGSYQALLGYGAGEDLSKRIANQ